MNRINALLSCCLVLCIGITVYAQEVEPSIVYKNINSKYLVYTDKKGNLLGCNSRFECTGLALVIYKLSFSEGGSKICIFGRVLDGLWPQDSTGVPGVSIIVGWPKGNKLTHIKVIGETILQDKPGSLVNDHLTRTGDFFVEANISKKDHLYFINPGYGLMEINIGNIIRPEKL